ncbi:hypothetical protein CERZMDRAFT_100774 [Cercospora zeae-maydis SCOH1-5]|uniref:Uncharacterized protein n=1 Tax=Cercospora zeae-maydis SCOH1-5 TaxID=717836 RepID=A0A6A6F5I5_9PEZI|nr:hypothetical protein CERZMDRAFT_100774 [Cercospora zeae-maydis SCOH1-5]
MPSSNRTLHSSIISLQTDLPFILGRKSVVAPSPATKQPLTTATTATSNNNNNLDKIATTALRAKAVQNSKSASGQSSNAQQRQQRQQQNSPSSTSNSSVSTNDTFSTWRQTQHWSDGIVRPPTQEFSRSSVASPHYWMKASFVPGGVGGQMGVGQQHGGLGR